MSAHAGAIPKNYFSKRSTEELIKARNAVGDILDFRALQGNFFTFADSALPPAPVPTPAPATPAVIPSCVPEVLSPSSVNCYNDCEAKWFYRKVLHLPEARSAALGLGAAVHVALGSNFRQKIATFEDLPVEGVKTIFRDAMEAELDTIALAADESAADLLDAGDAMIRVYMDQAAPTIQPAAVEIECAGLIGDVPVRGIIDLLDVDGRIIDIKTAKKKPASFPGSHRLQVATYAMIGERVSGTARLDTLTKTKTVSLDSRTIEIGPGDHQLTTRLYAITLDQMKSGLVKPNRGSFLCSRKYCGFADQCCSDYGGSVE